MLQISNVDFSRGDNQILYEFSLQAAAGELVYIRGPNGAGKTTLLKIVAGIITPQNGDVKWCGHRSSVVNPCIYLGHSSALKSVLTVSENLKFYQSIERGHFEEGKALCENIEQALEAVGLDGFAERYVHSLSAGQTKRVALARLVLTRKPLLIVDEPLNALDQHSAKVMQGIISELCIEYKKTMLITSHQDLSGLEPDKTVELIC